MTARLGRAPLALAAFLAAGVAAPAWAECAYQSGTYFPGNEITTRLTAKSGEACRRGFSARGSSIEYVRAEISMRATNGVAGMANASTFGYQSKKGFVGEDFFQITLHLRPRGGAEPIPTRINVRVTVTP